MTWLDWTASRRFPIPDCSDSEDETAIDWSITRKALALFDEWSSGYTVMVKAPKHHSLAKFTATCKSSSCERALLIAATAHAAANAILAAYELVRSQRGRPRGMTTDNEQDLLRSMLVMAASGVDATVKQLVQDTLPHLIATDAKAQNSFQKFVERKLIVEADTGGGTVNLKLLAAALVSPAPQRRLIDEYVSELTGNSLQSTDSLFQVAAALGVDPVQIGLIPRDIRPIFNIRNKIIHELDINLDARTRTRNLRSQATMIRDTEKLFSLIQALVLSVDSRVT